MVSSTVVTILYTIWFFAVLVVLGGSLFCIYRMYAFMKTRRLEKMKKKSPGIILQGSNPRKLNVVIVNGDKGFGFYLAKYFLLNGCNVVVVSKNKEKMDQSIKLLIQVTKNESIRGLVFDSATANASEILPKLKDFLVHIDFWIVDTVDHPYVHDRLENVSEENLRNDLENVSEIVCSARLGLLSFQKQKFGGHLFLVSGKFGVWAYSHSSVSQKLLQKSIDVLFTELKKEAKGGDVGIHLLLKDNILDEDSLESEDAKIPIGIKRISNVFCEKPDVVTQYFVKKMLRVSGTGKILKYYGRVSVALKSIKALFGGYRNTFYDWTTGKPLLATTVEGHGAISSETASDEKKEL